MKAKIVDVEKVESTVKEYKTELIIAGVGVVFITGYRIGYKIGGIRGMIGLYKSLETLDKGLFDQLITKGIETGATIHW